jgi:RNase H-fold protein (predicted Holliday junction resolvase)/ribosomal protein S25
MQKITGKPKFMKELNISEIKKAVLENPMITRSSVAALTNISLTTVGNILSELTKEGDILTGGYEESSGGRKAEKYYFNMEKYYSLAFCVDNESVKYVISDVLCEIVESGELNTENKNVQEIITDFTEQIIKERNIKAIALGVPGIVTEGGYLISGLNKEWVQNNIGNFIQENFDIPVILENDLNSTVLGFSINYTAENESETLESLSSVYIEFSGNCTGAGIISNGELIHGKDNFAGEFGFIPVDGMRTIDDVINNKCTDKEYTEAMVKLILIINYTINPAIIIMGGKNFREGLLESIVEKCKKYMPKGSFPEIIYKKNNSWDYFRGISRLGVQLMHKNIGL